MLDGAGQPIGLHLGLDLRDVVPEHDDIVGLAVNVADMIAQQCLGLEAEALEQRDRGLLIDRHLDRELFEAGAERECEGLLRQRPTHPLSAHIERNHHPDLADMGDQECGSRTSVPQPTTVPPLTASRLVIAPRSISLTQAESTFGSLMLRGRNNRSWVGRPLPKASTAASSAGDIRRISISPASVFT